MTNFSGLGDLILNDIKIISFTGESPTSSGQLAVDDYRLCADRLDTTTKVLETDLPRS